MTLDKVTSFSCFRILRNTLNAYIRVIVLARISFHEMAKSGNIWIHLRFRRFLSVRIETILLTSNLLPSISLVVGQSSVTISLVTRAHDVSSSRLTSSQ